MTQDIKPELIEPPYPLQDLLGMRVTGWKDGWARVEIPVADHLKNRQGIPHGGIHATLLDSAMGYAGCYTGDPDIRQMAMTLSMTVNYMAQVQGTRLFAEATVTGGGRKTYFAEGRLSDDQGTLIATSTGVFRYRSGS